MPTALSYYTHFKLRNKKAANIMTSIICECIMLSENSTLWNLFSGHLNWPQLLCFLFIHESKKELTKEFNKKTYLVKRSLLKDLHGNWSKNTFFTQKSPISL